jgi:hypothetical protein
MKLDYIRAWADREVLRLEKQNGNMPAGFYSWIIAKNYPGSMIAMI